MTQASIILSRTLALASKSKSVSVWLVSIRHYQVFTSLNLKIWFSFNYHLCLKVQMEQAKAQFSRFSHDERKCSREQWNVTGTSESHFVPKRIFSIQTWRSTRWSSFMLICEALKMLMRSKREYCKSFCWNLMSISWWRIWAVATRGSWTLLVQQSKSLAWWCSTSQRVIWIQSQDKWFTERYLSYRELAAR